MVDISRRDLFKIASASGLVATGIVASQGTVKPLLAQTQSSQTQIKKGEMIYRTMGRTGEEVSLVGLGGHHIGRLSSEREAIALTREAIDRGINFMDNCWDYHDGKSEIWMGKALQDGYRDRVFLMTKIDGRTKKAASKQIDESLKRLQTDRIDLLQHHEIIRLEDPDRVFASNGSMEAVLEAQKAGKVRYIGFTGHKDPLVHLRMLDIAEQNDFRFDAVQMPLNVMDAHFRSFEREVLPILVKREIGVLGMKSMGDPYILRSKVVTPIECLHYAMNLPTSTVITGIESRKILDQAIQAVNSFEPMSEERVAELLDKTRDAAENGEYELFKTTSKFDGTAKNPQWLG